MDDSQFIEATGDFGGISTYRINILTITWIRDRGDYYQFVTNMGYQSATPHEFTVAKGTAGARALEQRFV